MVNLNVSEKFDLTLRLVVIVPVFLLKNLLVVTTFAWWRRLPLREYLRIATIRTFLTCLTPRQIVAVSRSTTATYERWMSRKTARLRASPRANAPEITLAKATEILDDGIAKLHWLRNSSLKHEKVLLFFHGGGYNAPLTDGHLNWCFHLLKSCALLQRPIAICLLEYSLTPESHYPTQLRQATSGLRRLLHHTKPADIIIGGDSAGGNLALALLAHILHPNPAVERLDLSGPLAGAFVVSPWLTNDMGTTSYAHNACVDMLSPALVRRSAADYLRDAPIQRQRGDNGNVAHHGWTLALDAGTSWWEKLGDVARSVYLTAGAQEMFRDHVIEMAHMLESAQGKRAANQRAAITVSVGERETHDHILLWSMMGQESNPASDKMVNWLSTVLKE